MLSPDRSCVIIAVMTVRTRFAPNPTGYLHIGGVRTALFCYLFAKKHRGQFILRIDDTDQQRNVNEALQPILDGLHWLGIDWDEGPGIGGPHASYYQSQQSEKYQAAVEELYINPPAPCQRKQRKIMYNAGIITHSESIK